MSRRSVAPWLLAASVFLTGATGVLVGAITPAHAITSVEELRDVDSSHWAYQALADLVEKYDVIEGYPDYTFKGKKTATRWEMAAALNALIKAVGRDLARLGAEKANKSDLATLARLQEEFRNELAALNSRVGALESRASAIEAKNTEQDTRLDLLEKTQLHGDMSMGFLADIGGNGSTALGMTDNITTIGRLRLGVKVPVVEGYDNSAVGEGDVIARLVAGFGRWAPDSANGSTSTPISGYSALASSADTNARGVAPNSNSTGIGDGINLRSNVYLESAYYKQHFKPGIPILTDLFPGMSVLPDNDKYRTTADLYVGVLPWRNLFDRSPYRGDELNQFQNSALVNNIGLLVNNVVPTVALAWHQGLGEHFSADLTAAIAAMDTSDALNGWSITEELAINYDTWFLGQKYTKPGTFYGGGYHIFFMGNQNLRVLNGPVTNRDGEALLFNENGNDSLNALYLGMNQEWWRGIGTSLNFVLNDSNPNNALITSLRNDSGINVNRNTISSRAVGVKSAVSGVLTMPLTVFNKNLTKRANDHIGLGYSFIVPTQLNDGGFGPNSFNSALRNGDTNEHVFEGFYRWAVNNSMTVMPSIQVIVNRMGLQQNAADVIFGLRTNYVF